jgi:hypothetical protein
MTRSEKIRKLKAALRTARYAKGQAFRAWEIAKHVTQDDLSPRERRQRLRRLAAAKRGCLKAARLCAAIEIHILAPEMERVNEKLDGLGEKGGA